MSPLLRKTRSSYPAILILAAFCVAAGYGYGYRYHTTTTDDNALGPLEGGITFLADTRYMNTAKDGTGSQPGDSDDVKRWESTDGSTVLTLVGSSAAPTWDASEGALSFSDNELADDTGSLSAFKHLHDGSDVTVAVRLAVEDDDNLNVILDTSNASSGNTGFALRREANNKVELNVMRGSSGNEAINEENDFVVEDDGLVDLVYSVDSGTASLWVDGTKYGLTVDNTFATGDHSTPLTVGRRATSNDLDLTGLVKEIRILKRSTDDAEVSAWRGLPPATPFPLGDYDLAFEGPSATGSSWVASTGGVTLNQSDTPAPVLEQSTSPVTNPGRLEDSAVQFSGGYYSGGPYTLPQDANGKTTVRVLLKHESETGSGDATVFSWARQRGGSGQENYIELQLRGTNALLVRAQSEATAGGGASFNTFINGTTAGDWVLLDLTFDRTNGAATYYRNGTETDPGSGSAYNFGSSEEGYLWVGARTNETGILTSAGGGTTEPLLDDQRVLFLGFRAGGITLNEHRNDAEKLGLWSP